MIIISMKIVFKMWKEKKRCYIYNLIYCSMPLLFGFFRLLSPFCGGYYSLFIFLFKFLAISLMLLCVNVYFEIVSNNSSSGNIKNKMRYYISIVDRTNEKKNYYRNESVVLLSRKIALFWINKINLCEYRKASSKRNRFVHYTYKSIFTAFNDN